MSCEWIKDNLFDYLDRKLDQSQERIFKKHLQTCTSCSREYEKVLHAWKMLDSWEDLPPPKHLQRNILSSIRRRREAKWLRILVPAAAALLIITGLAFLYRGADTKNYHKLAVSNEPTPVRLPITAENEADIISNLQLLREKEFYDSLDKLEKIDYLPLVEDASQEDERDQRSSLELLTV